MGPQSSIFRRIPTFLMIAGVALLVGVFLWPQLFPTAGRHGRFIASTLSHRWSVANLMEIYAQAWVSVQKKADTLRHLDEENAKLRLQNAHLKVGLETLEFQCHSQKGSSRTHDFQLKLSHETGAKVGRTLASLNYKLPTQLHASQLYTLGVSYLKAGEDEKAAVIFTSLTGQEDNDAYKTAKNLLLTGLAWYRIENYILADHYFDAVLKTPERNDSVEFQAQARLWKAVLAKKFNKNTKSQFWLQELIDHHPHSREAAWVNVSAAKKGDDH